jgi:hypothetical protein
MKSGIVLLNLIATFLLLALVMEASAQTRTVGVNVGNTFFIEPQHTFGFASFCCWLASIAVKCREPFCRVSNSAPFCERNGGILLEENTPLLRNDPPVGWGISQQGGDFLNLEILIHYVLDVSDYSDSVQFPDLSFKVLCERKLLPDLLAVFNNAID